MNKKHLKKTWLVINKYDNSIASIGKIKYKEYIVDPERSHHINGIWINSSLKHPLNNFYFLESTKLIRLLYGFD